jgi:hypothetical protein
MIGDRAFSRTVIQAVPLEFALSDDDAAFDSAAPL